MVDPVNRGKERMEMSNGGAQTYSRRTFLRVASAAVAGVGIGAGLAGQIGAGTKVQIVEAAERYLVVDTEKCGTCTACMVSCSMAHYGRASQSLARIQIVRNPHANFPDDVEINQCRQCVNPACLVACPTDALHVDSDNFGVRKVDYEKCLACQRCIEACPFVPSRAQYNFEDKWAQKCDLCTSAPYWDAEQDGPACAKMCPLNAIKVVDEVPVQVGDIGYVVDLKPDKWGPRDWGYPW